MVYSLVKQIPPGKVTTYGAIAAAMGNPRAARAIGMLMHTNPDAPKIPCHRVVRSNGNIGGYSGRGGKEGKVKMLKKEGIVIENDFIMIFKKVFYGDFEK